MDRSAGELAAVCSSVTSRQAPGQLALPGISNSPGIHAALLTRNICSPRLIHPPRYSFHKSVSFDKFH